MITQAFKNLIKTLQHPHAAAITRPLRNIFLKSGNVFARHYWDVEDATKTNTPGKKSTVYRIASLLIGITTLASVGWWVFNAAAAQHMLIRVGLAAVISAKASGMSMALFPFAVGGGCALLHASREFLRSPYTALHGAAYTAAYKKINGSKAPKNAGTDSVGPQKKKLFDFKRLFSTESRMRKHMGDALIAELSGERPNIEICRQFIQAGADLRRHDKAGCTALIHTASIPELSVLARQLLVHGADINARNKIGKTARDVAKEQENNDDMINVFKPSNVKEAYAEGFRHVAEKGTPRKHKIHRRKPAAGAPT